MSDTELHPKPTRRGTVISAGIVLGALITGIVVLRDITLDPRTDDAEIVANFIGMAPLVEGPVVQLPVQDNQFVKKGELLYKIDDRPYLYALQNAVAAQAQLEGDIENENRRIAAQVSNVQVAEAGSQSSRANDLRANDDVKASEASVQQATAALQQVEADADYAVGNLHRIEPLLAKEFVTPDDVHRAKSLAESKQAAVQAARSQLAVANAKLLAARDAKQQALAQVSQSRAQVAESGHAVSVIAPLIAQRGSRAAAVQLAQYNYDQCSIVAPFDARVTNLTISEGQYAKVGQQMFTLIDTRTWWVLANFRETQLNHVRPGEAVEVFLMSDAHTRLRGVVESAGFGVTPDPDVVGKLTQGLPDVQRTLNWVRLASRYPVRIRLIDPPPGVLRMGQVADVVMRSDEHVER